MIRQHPRKSGAHGELGAVLVPGKPYKPRSEASKKLAGNSAVNPDVVESKADIARRHLPILEKNLAVLRAAGAAEDSGPVVYHKTQIAKMQAELERGSAQDSSGRSTNQRSDSLPPETAVGSLPPEPPANNGPISTNDDDPVDRLNRLFQDQTNAATSAQRFSVRRWQGRDRFYEKVQVAAVGFGDPEAMAVVQQLSDLARPLPEDVQVWRGIRSAKSAFGVNSGDLIDLIGRSWSEDRFLATTTNREVATPEFTRPGAQPAILRITARSGSMAVWIAPLGESENAAQGELLFTPGVGMRIIGVDGSGEIPIIEIEVSPSGQV